MADMRNTTRGNHHAMWQPALRPSTPTPAQPKHHEPSPVRSSAYKPLERILAILLAVGLVMLGIIATAANAPRAVAAETVTGSLTVSAVWNRDTSSALPLAGDTYSIVRVASADLDGNGRVKAFHMLNTFSEFSYNWGHMDPSAYNAAAKTLTDYATAHQLYEHAGVTDANGSLTFRNLPIGLYLVARTGIATANQRYSCDPFLVAVPGNADDGTGQLNVTVEPKFSDNGGGTPGEPGEPGEPGKPGEPENPGDNPGDNPGNEPGETPGNTPGGTGTTPGGTNTNTNTNTGTGTTGKPADTGAAVSTIALAAIALTVAAVIIRDLRRDRNTVNISE
ncbi:hypothetical protein [Bifidobacterium biavatii]|uniref:Putative surface-anchored protein n=1 Tax=Bifidobacterium biavatii DSM 23969 TaxID=1437608 RepID=A0A087A4M8_9BIFI|nr:hypothetical protein [Bifidobacterium biavatii]KFI53728.1 putative surface-anchored protein [Bifidobacterium biavatii DSM 23969]